MFGPICPTHSIPYDSRPQPPRTLNARVEPDLEAICLRALEKNPASRYSVAEAFAEDLERYLAHEPVAARPVGWWRRRARWLRKHPLRTAIILAIVIAIVGLLTIIALQSIELHKLRREVEQTKTRPTASERQAENLRKLFSLPLSDLRLFRNKD